MANTENGNTSEHFQRRLVGLQIGDKGMMAGVEFVPNVVITDPKVLERLTKTKHQPVDHVEPYRLCFVSRGSCDYCGPMPHEKDAEMFCLPVDHLIGILACDKCGDKARTDVKNYCVSNLRYLITDEKLKGLGLGGDLKIRRSSGGVENGWYVNTNGLYVITFGKDGKIVIPMIRHSTEGSEAFLKGVRLSDICDLNGLNFQELSTKIQ